MSPPALEVSVTTATIELLDQLFTLVRSLALHGPEHDEVQAALVAVQNAVERARPPFALQLLPEAVLRDARPLPLSLEHYRRAQQLVGALARFGQSELLFEQVPPPAALLAFAEAMRDATHKSKSVRTPQLSGIRMRPCLRPTGAAQPNEGAIELFVTRLLEQAYAGVEQLAQRHRGGAYPFELANPLLWKLERCTQASPEVTARCIELSAPPFPPARRALAAAFHTGALLDRLGAPVITRRAAMHAALALGCSGYAEREGLPLRGAAGDAFQRLIPSAGSAPRNDPLRLRVCALLSSAARAAASEPGLPLAALLATVYEFELRRCPREGLSFLGRGDLHAWLAGALGQEVHGGWGRALLQVLAPIAPGTHVLCDGRLGLTLGAAQHGDPLRPRVLVGGAQCVPGQPVAVYSPAGMTPWIK